MPLLTRSFSDRPPFRIFEVPAGETAIDSPATPSTAPAKPLRDVTPHLVGGAVGERRSGERRG